MFEKGWGTQRVAPGPRLIVPQRVLLVVGSGCGHAGFCNRIKTLYEETNTINVKKTCSKHYTYLNVVFLIRFFF